MPRSNTPRIQAVLLLPTHVPDLVKVGHSVVTAMTGNTFLPNPNPLLPPAIDALTKLDAAEAAVGTRTKGTVEVRNAAKRVFVAQMHALKAQVQQAADAHPEDAEAIITSAAMNVKKTATQTKAPFAVKPGPITGSAHLVAKAAAARASYEWAWSGDAGKTWTPLDSTLKAKTIAIGLPAGVVVQFRFRAVTKAGVGDWSQPVSLLVK